MSEMFTICSSCGRGGRPDGDFRPGHLQCKSCESHATKARQAQAAKDDPYGTWWRRAVQAARSRSKKRGYTDFGLEEETPIVMPARCPLFDTVLNYGQLEKGEGESPSIDQIMPGGGYVYGNVAIISHTANQIKSNGTAQDHRDIAAFMDLWEIMGANWYENRDPTGGELPLPPAL